MTTHWYLFSLITIIINGCAHESDCLQKKKKIIKIRNLINCLFHRRRRLRRSGITVGPNQTDRKVCRDMLYAGRERETESENKSSDTVRRHWIARAAISFIQIRNINERQTICLVACGSINFMIEWNLCAHRDTHAECKKKIRNEYARAVCGPLNFVVLESNRCDFISPLIIIIIDANIV